MSNTPVPIAFCITDLDPGGAERILFRLVTGLNRQEWSPVVYCLGSEGKIASDLKDAEIPVTCLGARHWSNCWVVARLARLLRRQRPQLLQTFLFHANIAGRLAGKLAGVPHIVSGIRVAERRSRLPLVIDRCSNWMVTANTCVSHAVARFSVEEAGLNPRKLVVIPNGVDIGRFRDAEPADLAPFGIPAGSRVAIVVGRLDEQKDPLLAIEALSPLFEEHPDFHLLFVGDGRLETQMRKRIDDLGVQQHVHLAGWRADVANLLKASSMLVLPSRWEGMPNVVLEAMAAGTPVVAANVEGTSELIQDGDNGMLFPVSNALALSKAVDDLLSGKANRTSISDAAQQHITANFTIRIMIDRYVSFYRAILSDSGNLSAFSSFSKKSQISES